MNAIALFAAMFGVGAVLFALSYRIATACRHKWTVLRRASVMNSDYEYPVGFDYELQCEHCGAVKSKRV